MTAEPSRASRILEQPKLAGYYVVMSIVVLIFAGLWSFEGYYLFTAWFPALFDEITPINGVMAGGFMTLMLACSVAALLRPTSMVGPSKVLIVGAAVLGFTLPFAFILSDPLLTLTLSVVAVTILTLLITLHPGGSEVLPARRAEPDTLLLGLTVIIAIPFLWMAGTFQWSQITLDDEVAQRWFYGGYSMYLTAIVALMVVTSFDGSTRRITASTVVFLAGILGLVSVVYPSQLHSLGLTGGGVLLAWSCAVALATVRQLLTSSPP